MYEDLVFKTSKSKDHVTFKEPKNYKTSDLESYCETNPGVFVWCYFSSELGVFIKNLTSKATERFLTIEGIEYLDISYNTQNSTFILLYKKEGEFYVRYFDSLETFEYKTKSISLNCTKAFVHFSELYKKGMIVFKDKTTNRLMELNSLDEFQTLIDISNVTYEKQELLQIGISEETGILSFDFVVIDNTLLKDLALYPKFKDFEYRTYPINVSEFNYVKPKKG